MSGHSKFNPTLKPVQVYPARTAAQKKLASDVAAAMNHGCPATSVLETVQKFIDRQQKEQKHKEAVAYLTGIFAKICKRCAESPEDRVGYVDALREMVNDPPYRGLHINDPRDFLPESHRKLPPLDDLDPKNAVVTSYPKMVTDLIARFASASADVALAWVAFVDHMLDVRLGGDFFGTDGQLDPRGDRRDD